MKNKELIIALIEKDRILNDIQNLFDDSIISVDFNYGKDPFLDDIILDLVGIPKECEGRADDWEGTEIEHSKGFENYCKRYGFCRDGVNSLLSELYKNVLLSDEEIYNKLIECKNEIENK